MVKPLNNKGIWITRPKHQAEQLTTLVTQAGGRAIVVPTLAIMDPPKGDSLTTAIEQLPKQAIAIFTSPNAVQKALPKILARWRQWPNAVKVAAVGDGTAHCLSDYGVSVSLRPIQHFNSEGLLALTELQQVADQAITIFQGEGGRGMLSSELSARGAHLTIAIAYQRVIPSYQPEELPNWQANAIDYIISTSNESLKNLFKLVGEAGLSWLQHQVSLVLISERTAIMARELGVTTQLIVADQASDTALVAALITAEQFKNKR